MRHSVALGKLADIGFVKGAPVVKSQGAQPTAWIYVDVTGSDIRGYVPYTSDAAETENTVRT